MRINEGDLSDIDLFILDMDGTFYLGNELFAGSLEFLNKVKRLNRKFIFLTNNSSKSSKDYMKKLKSLGIIINENEIFTSGEATCLYLKTNYDKDTKYFVLGTESLIEEFERNNLKVSDTKPDVVVLGYDTTITYEKIVKMAVFLRKGLPYVSTHPDINCPDPLGLIPDAGAFIELFKASTTRSPDVIIGKPNKYIIEMALKKVGTYSKAMIIGDRLYTDMLSGINANIKTSLVLSGETTIEDLESSDINPDFVFESVKDMIDKI